MAEILLGSHVGMSGKEMFLGSVKEAESYGANVLMVYTGAPQNTMKFSKRQLSVAVGRPTASSVAPRVMVVPPTSSQLPLK